MHPYELQSVIKLTHKEDFLQLKPGSLYNAIERLLKAGLIEVVETSRAGRRPERTVYKITVTGNQEMLAWLRELLAKPSSDSTQFYAALSFLPVLDPRDVVAQLLKRVEALDESIRNYENVLVTITPRIGRLNLVEVEYALVLRRAECRWIREIIDDLETSKLTWNPEILLKQAAQYFETCISAPQKTP